MKAKAPTGGYPNVTLCRGGRMTLFSVHRLVLLAFIGPPGPGQECRHLDGNPANNHFDNLCWGTSAENKADSKRHCTAYTLTAEDVLKGSRKGSRKAGLASAAKLTDEQRREMGRRLHLARMERTTPEQRVEWARKAGRVSGMKRREDAERQVLRILAGEEIPVDPPQEEAA